MVTLDFFNNWPPKAYICIYIQSRTQGYCNTRLEVLLKQFRKVHLRHLLPDAGLALIYPIIGLRVRRPVTATQSKYPRTTPFNPYTLTHTRSNIFIINTIEFGGVTSGRLLPARVAAPNAFSGRACIPSPILAGLIAGDEFKFRIRPICPSRGPPPRWIQMNIFDPTPEAAAKLARTTPWPILIYLISSAIDLIRIRRLLQCFFPENSRPSPPTCPTLRPTPSTFVPLRDNFIEGVMWCIESEGCIPTMVRLNTDVRHNIIHKYINEHAHSHVCVFRRSDTIEYVFELIIRWNVGIFLSIVQ